MWKKRMGNVRPEKVWETRLQAGTWGMLVAFSVAFILEEAESGVS